MSLRGRIRALTVGATALVLTLFIVPMGLLLQHAASEDSQHKAIDLAQGVADYLSTGVTDRTVIGAYVDRVERRNTTVRVGVVLADGTRLGSEQALPTDSAGTKTGSAGGDVDQDGDHGGSLPDDHDRDNGLAPTGSPEFRNVSGGRQVLIVVPAATGHDRVAVLVPNANVRSTVLARLALLAGVALALLVVAAAVAELFSRRLVRDLSAAAQVADRLGEGDLSARVEASGPPEVQRVGEALNRLAGRIDELLVAERETVADLSHRLRTPLMAVRLDVEGLPHSERTEELEAHLDHLERTLTAVIRAARRPEREGVRPHSDAAAIVTERVAYWAPLAEDQGRTIEAVVPAGPVDVRCAAEDLRAVVDALVENVVAHTPEGTPISVVLDPEPDSAAVTADQLWLEVRDRGPGVPPDAVRRGRSDRGSTGLGLDIARATAAAGGGHLELDQVDGWSVVRLVLSRVRLTDSGVTG